MEEETKSVEKNQDRHINFLFRKFVSKHDFQREYKQLFHNESDYREIYIISLVELGKSIEEGNLKNFSQLSKVIDYLSNQSDPLKLNEFYDSLDNPLRRSNFFILCCKYNSLEIMKCIIDNNNNILFNFTNLLKRKINVTDVDENNHGAFYYAVRSNNTEILDILYNKWKKEYFPSSIQKLDDILSGVYDELNLKNIFISRDMKINVQIKLMDLRFFSSNYRSVEGSIGHQNDISQRLGSVIQHITILVNEFLITDKVDDKFLFVVKTVIKNIHILKQQLKVSYERVPWEEIEYCLTVFVSSLIKRENNKRVTFFCKAYLSRNKLLRYLIYFSKLLEEENNFILNSPSSHPSKIPKVQRVEVTAKIISNCPEFKSLYDDYQQIRDIDSLSKIDEAIRLILSTGANELVGQLAILRSLQVIGEHLKNSLESPKISKATGDLFLLSLPKNTRDIIINIRNSLSHASSSLPDQTFSSKYYVDIQSDIKKVGDVTSNILYSKQMAKVKSLLCTVLASEDINEIKEIISILCYIDPKEFSEASVKTEHSRVSKLVKLLSEKIPNKTEFVKKEFKQLNEILNLEGQSEWSGETLGLMLIKNLRSMFLNIQFDLIPHHSLKTMVRQATENFLSSEQPDKLKSVFIRAFFIFATSDIKIEPNDVFLSIFCEIASLYQLSEVIHISKLREFLKCSSSSLQRNAVGKEDKLNNNALVQSVKKLKCLLRDVSYSSHNEFVISVLNNTKLKAAVEMIILEIMSTLSGAKNYLENNILYLDDDAPLLIGKSLRNHLAHDNVIADIILSEPGISVILNAKKIIDVNLANAKKRIGKLVKENPSRLRDKFDYTLITLSYQRRMFAAAQEGDLVQFKHWLAKGADLHGKCSQSFTALHYAAMGTCLGVIKFLAKNGLSIEDRNIDGETPLHIAITYGSLDIVEFLLKDLGSNVNAKDNYGKEPLYNAIQRGKKEMVELLLKYNALVDLSSGLGPIAYAAMYNYIDIFYLLVENSEVYDYQDSGGSLLKIVSEFGHVELINSLLERNPNFKGKCGMNWTPLHSAAQRYGKADIVKALIEKGMDVNARTLEGFTALYNSVFSGDEKIVEVLLNHGADSNIVDKTLNYSCIYVGSRDGREQIVKLLLENKGDVNIVNFVGESPLHVAAQNGHKKIISYLLEYGADPNAMDNSLTTPVFRAAFHGFLDVIKMLVHNGADINIKNNDFFSPLHVAAQNGHECVVNYLIKENAAINEQNILGSTPLHLACENGRKSTVEVLIENKALVDIEDQGGHTPLHFAASVGQAEVASVLLNHYASVNAAGIDNITPLRIAINFGHKAVVETLIIHGARILPNDLSQAIESNDLEVVSLLLKNIEDLDEGLNVALKASAIKGSHEVLKLVLMKKPNINLVDFKCYTPLHYAACRGHVEIINSLLGHGAHANSLSADLSTPLHLAIGSGNEDAIVALIKGGANVNAISNENESPLHIAVLGGDTKIVRILLDNGAKVDLENCISPLELAVANSHLDIIKVLQPFVSFDLKIEESRKDGWNILHLATAKSNLETVKHLVHVGCDINVRSYAGLKPIHLAAWHGHKDTVEYLINIGANIDDLDSSCLRPLHYAARGRNIEVVKLLVGKGCNINAQDKNGWSTLHYAASYDCTLIINFLLNAGAAYDIEDNDHVMPGDIAMSDGIMDLFEYIEDLFLACMLRDPTSMTEIKKAINKGALINTKNVEGQSPLHLVVSEGNLDAVKYLLEMKANPNIADNEGFMPLHLAAKYSHLDIVLALLSRGAIYNATSIDRATPSSLATNKQIVNLLRTINNAFDSVQKRNNHVINDLKKLSDISLIKAIMNACNIDNLTLVTAAVKYDYKKVDLLKNVFEGDVSHIIKEAHQLILLGNFDKARSILNDLYSRRKAILGPDNPGTLDVLFEISKVIYKQGHYLEVLNLREEILSKQKNILGFEHPDTLNSRSSIALILHRLGRDHEAIEIFQEVFPKQKAILGNTHEVTISTQFHMAASLDKLGKHDEALVNTKAVYERWLNKHGPNGQPTIAAQNNIAMFLCNQGKVEEGLKTYREVYKKKKTFYGAMHYDTLRTLHHIGATLACQKRYKEAISTFQEVLSNQKSILGLNHPDTMHTLYNLANVYTQTNQQIEAMKLYKSVSNNVGNILGTSHNMSSEVQTMLDTLSLYDKLNDFKGLNVMQQCQQKMNKAAEEGDTVKIKFLLEEGADINDRDPEGRTALHYAVNNQNLNTIKFLLKNGADATEVTNKGNSPLHTAASKNNLAIIELLLENISQDKRVYFVNGKTASTKTTCLHIAAKNGSLGIVKALLKHGATYNILNKESKTPLDVATECQVILFLTCLEELFRFTAKGDYSFVIKRLNSLNFEEFSAVSGARNDDGITLLQLSTICGYKDISLKLLEFLKKT